MTDRSIVIFDVGNVLIEWDPRHLYRKVFDGDEDRVAWFLANITTPAWNLEQDRGRSFGEAVAALQAEHPQYADEIAAFDTRWHEMVPGEIQPNVAVLQDLQTAGVPTYAITNFSREKWAEACQRFAFLSSFRGAVVSGAEGVIKPDPVIYQRLFDRYGLAADACVFFDDSERNVAAASALGVHAVHVTPQTDLRLELSNVGINIKMA